MKKTLLSSLCAVFVGLAGVPSLATPAKLKQIAKNPLNKSLGTKNK